MIRPDIILSLEAGRATLKRQKTEDGRDFTDKSGILSLTGIVDLSSVCLQNRMF